MRSDAVYARLAEIFAEVFGRTDIALGPHLTARHVEGWDSFRQIEIILAVEQRFGIKVTTRDLDTLHSVGDLVALIEHKADRPA